MKKSLQLLTLAFGVLQWPQLEAAPPASDRHDLFRAIRHSDKIALNKLLNSGASLAVHDERGNTPLHGAALHGDAETLQWLLEKGADPNATNHAGATPLHYAVSDPAKVRLLLDRGVNPNARSKLDNTPLIVAAGHPESAAVVELLLNKGADANARNAAGVTALFNAADEKGGDAKTVELLLQHGVDPNTRALNSRPALSIAARSGHKEIVQILLRHGANPNLASTNSTGHALNAAFFGEQPDIAKLLIQHGADLNLPSPMGLVSPMVWAAYTETGDTSLARMLIARGVDLNHKNELGETALDWANKRGHKELIEILTRAGAKPGTAQSKTKEIPSREVPAETEARKRRIEAGIEQAVALLQISSDAFLENKGVKERAKCVSCHQQTLPAVAFGWARSRGLRMNEELLHKQIETHVRWWTPGIDRAYEMQLHTSTVGAPNTIGYGMLGLAALGHPADELTEAMVWHLAASQWKDGRWRARESRPPMQYSDISSTALALGALQSYPLAGREKEFQDRLAHAAHWLKQATPQTQDDRVFQLLGLGWAGVKPSRLKPLVHALVDQQRPDGGWAQLPGLGSDAWATGQTLVALKIAGGLLINSPQFERGINFLLRTQFEDGSWYVRSRSWPFQEHFDSKFPHGKDQWISAAATAWAVMALTLTIEPSSANLASRQSASFLQSSTSPTAPSDLGKRPATRSSQPGPRAEVATIAVVDFTRDIKPILERSCVGCHGGEKPKSDFRIESRESLLKGGESGEAAIIPGHSSKSPLIRFVSGEVEDLEMPPTNKRDKYPALTKEQIGRLRAWIDRGAPWPDGIKLNLPK